LGLITAILVIMENIKSPQAHYKKGEENKITFIFSCPGKAEKDAKPPQPLVGIIRKNVELFWTLLNYEFNTNDFSRDKITISNASSNIYYGSAGTEAPDNEIKGDTNLRRLWSEIRHTEDLIVCSGKKAQLAINEIRKRDDLKVECNKIIFIPHLGFTSLNQIQTNAPSPKERTRERITKILKEFLEQYRAFS
jgi:hypothetical protein